MVVEPHVCFDKLSPHKHTGLSHAKQLDVPFRQRKKKSIANFLGSLLVSMPMTQAADIGLMLNKPEKQMFIATLGTHHPFAAFPEGYTGSLQETMG